GEAGQPAQALGALGDVFALMLVGAGHEEAVEPGLRHARAQPRHPVDALRGIGERVEGLEHRGPRLPALSWIVSQFHGNGGTIYLFVFLELLQCLSKAFWRRTESSDVVRRHEPSFFDVASQ